MKENTGKERGKAILTIAAVLMLAAAATILITMPAEDKKTDILPLAGGGDWAKNFGGEVGDRFYAVAAADIGFVAVGYSQEASFKTGDWADTEGNGGYDAVIVKFGPDGSVIWKKNFGGKGDDRFHSVTAVDGGFIAVGYSQDASFNTGDWIGTEGKGYFDAIIVKFGPDGSIIWKKNFGGESDDRFYSVAATAGGFVAVGNAHEESFDNGDWTGTVTRGDQDAVIVEFDNDGVAVWKKAFGGAGADYFTSVAVTDDGFVAVGDSEDISFNTGDWAGKEKKGGSDAIIVKFGPGGSIEWAKNFGGSRADKFTSVAVAGDGYAAVGNSHNGSFGTGDWTDTQGKGGNDAVIAMFGPDGSIEWSKNFGGGDNDYFNSATATADGIIVAGEGIIIGGDWEEIGDGDYAAVAVKYTFDGSVDWRMSFGGSATDMFFGILAADGKYVAVGGSYEDSFLTEGWGDTPRGMDDAIIVGFSDSSSGKVVYSIAYNGNGSDGGTVPATEVGKVPLETYVLAGPGTMTRADALFIGWSKFEEPLVATQAARGSVFPVTEANLKVEHVVALPSETFNVYALWAADINGDGVPDYEEEGYSIEYDGNGFDGGAVPAAEEGRVHSAEYTLADAGTMKRSKAVFIGWSKFKEALVTSEAAEGSIITAEKVKLTPTQIDDLASDTFKVYAVWAADVNNDGVPDYKEGEYSIRYNGNGSDGGEVPSTETGKLPLMTYDLAAAGTMARSDAVFIGWSKFEEPLVTTQAAEGSIITLEKVNLTAMQAVSLPSATLDIYAVWAVDADGDGVPDYAENNDGTMLYIAIAVIAMIAAAALVYMLVLRPRSKH
jgi:hypothetical protein